MDREVDRQCILKMDHSRPLCSFIFFKQTLQFLQQYIVKNIHPVSRTPYWDSNPQPLERESPPVTLDDGSRPDRKCLTLARLKMMSEQKIEILKLACRASIEPQN